MLPFCSERAQFVVPCSIFVTTRCWQTSLPPPGQLDLLLRAPPKVRVRLAAALEVSPDACRCWTSRFGPPYPKPTLQGDNSQKPTLVSWSYTPISWSYTLISSFLATTMLDHKLKNKPEKTCEVHANFWSSGTWGFTKFGLSMPSFRSHLDPKARATTRRAKRIFSLLIKQFCQIPPLKYQ